jgi:hypothetical protein
MRQYTKLEAIVGCRVALLCFIPAEKLQLSRANVLPVFPEYINSVTLSDTEAKMPASKLELGY